MKNLFRNSRSIMLFFVVMGMISSFFPTPESRAENITRIQGLNRVGPRDPATGYPLWYEDKSGLKLQLCLDPDNCFLEIPNPSLPLHMPTSANDPDANFPDESFYFAAESIFSGQKKGVNAILILALEGMFFSDAGVIVNDQAVMSRIRIRVDGLMDKATYTVIHPYGIETFVTDGDAGPGTAKGPGISMTRDLGLVEPLFFNGPLTGDIGPYLIPEGYTGGPFIGDGGATEVRLTGSPLKIPNAPGVNTNVFRIEGPDIALVYPSMRCASDRMAPLGPYALGDDDCVENFLFVVMGQVATKFGVKIDRATFSDEGGDVFVNVWADTVEGQTLIAMVDGGQAMNLTEGHAGNYFGRFSVPAGGIPQTIQVTNTTDYPPTSATSDITDELIIMEASYTVSQGLTVMVQSSDHIDASSITGTLKTGQASPIIFDLSYEGGGISIGKTKVPTGVAEEQPPLNIVVNSSYGGSAKAKVIIKGMATDGGSMNSVLAVAGPSQNVIADGTEKTVILNGSASIGPISLTYDWIHDGPPSIVLTNPTSAQTSFVTPTSMEQFVDGQLNVHFTLTVSDGNSSDSAIVTVNMVNPQAVPTDICSIEAGPRYSVNKGKWLIKGSCNLPENQLIEVFLGGSDSEHLEKNKIGETNVDAIGNWRVATGNGSAVEGVIPVSGGTDRVFMISERGGTAESTFTIK